jgi:hypothetical protein
MASAKVDRDRLVPVLEGELTGDQGGATAVAVLEHFE